MIPRECGQAIENALDTPGPVLVEALVDPFEPLMPPKGDTEAGPDACRISFERTAESRKDHRNGLKG
jgi:hypothetical protein